MKNPLSLILFFLVPALVLLGARGEASPDDTGMEAPLIRGFTLRLISEKEYYRAYVELLRLRSYYPAQLSSPEFCVTSYYLLYNAGRFREVSKGACGEEAASVFRFDASICTGELRGLASLVQGWSVSGDPALAPFFRKRQVLYHLLSARDPGKDCPAEFSDRPACRELSAYVRDARWREKTPALAAALGLVPGLGYIYAGKTGTGIAALFLISLNGLAAYYAFHSKNEAVGIVLCLTGTFFYTGSILGSYRAASSANTAIRDRTRAHLAESLELERDRDQIYRKYGLGRDGQN